MRLGHPGPAAGVTCTHPRPHLPARGQGQVSRAGGGTVGWGCHHQLSPSGPGAAPSTLSKADAGTSAHQQGTWPWVSVQSLLAGLGSMASGSLAAPASSAAPLLTSCLPGSPPTKRPSKLPAVRVLKAWGAVPWSRPRQGLPGRGRGSGSPQIKGLAETCQPLAPQPGCPHPQGTQEGTASLLIGSEGDGNYKAGLSLLVVHGVGG